jgi:hypothetical protein
VDHSTNCIGGFSGLVGRLKELAVSAERVRQRLILLEMERYEGQQNEPISACLEPVVYGMTAALGDIADRLTQFNGILAAAEGDFSSAEVASPTVAVATPRRSRARLGLRKLRVRRKIMRPIVRVGR